MFAAALVLVGLLLSPAGRVPPGPLTGSAFAIDGDTLQLGDYRIRLHGIDAPELDQHCTDASGKAWPCGRAARDLLRSRLANAQLSCLPHERDRYGRIVATCSAGGDDLASVIARAGLAVALGQYGAESLAARRQKSGIWAGQFDQPADWRRDNRAASDAFDPWGWITALLEWVGNMVSR
jgi:endonuclease YncB( thermonuclease family)